MSQDNNQDAHQDITLRLMESALVSEHEDTDKARIHSLAMHHCSGFTESHVDCARRGRTRTNAQQQL